MVKVVEFAHVPAASTTGVPAVACSDAFRPLLQAQLWRLQPRLLPAQHLLPAQQRHLAPSAAFTIQNPSTLLSSHGCAALPVRPPAHTWVASGTITLLYPTA